MQRALLVPPDDCSKIALGYLVTCSMNIILLRSSLMVLEEVLVSIVVSNRLLKITERIIVNELID